MTIYTHTLTCIIHAPLTEIAAHVGRALDPDTGGAQSFGIALSATGEEPATHYALDTPCDAEFAQAAPWLLDGGLLHGSICRDYAARWPDVDLPTVESVTTFCADCVLVVDSDLFSVLADNGLQIVRPVDA